MLKYEDLLRNFQNAGIHKGDTVLVQSAMRPIGYIDGGAQTVARALWDAIGSNGTLIAPAFCFTHQSMDCPLIDPKTEPSEVGQISEAIRQLPGAVRSIAYRHSFSAIGKHANEIVSVDPSISVFDMHSSYGKMLGFDTKILLLGVTYRNSTSHHFAQYLMQMTDREVVPMECRLKKEDGTISPIVLNDYRPKPRTDGAMYAYPVDFNRSGLALEQAGKVCISHVGNAVTRLFRMRDLIHYFVDNYAVNDNLFAEGPHGATVLPYGKTIIQEHVDSNGNVENVVWSCMDEAKIYKR